MNTNSSSTISLLLPPPHPILLPDRWQVPNCFFTKHITWQCNASLDKISKVFTSEVIFLCSFAKFFWRQCFTGITLNNFVKILCNYICNFCNCQDKLVTSQYWDPWFDPGGRALTRILGGVYSWTRRCSKLEMAWFWYTGKKIITKWCCMSRK